MNCSTCGTPNEAGRKFCSECGATLSVACASCGTPNAAGTKFCGECGTRLASAAAIPATPAPETLPPTAERRLVSVLFVDLVGFTTASEAIDPEDVRELLDRYFEVARTVVERYGGTVEKFIGDAVMAVWGAPTAHEDDAERAVRAALDIVAAVPALVQDSELQARAGVLTGEAAVTMGASGQGMVAGDIVNTASRLQSAAAPGTVLVGETTYRAAREAIAFEQAGEHPLKGKATPVPAWRAMSVVAMRRGSGRREVLEPPFVGRDEELRLLKELLHATIREGKPRLVSVIGQAGIGKSRLAWELEKYIDGVVDTIYWHIGRSPAYGEGVAYWSLAEMVRRRALIAETDDPAAAAGKLSAVTAEWLPDNAERRWVEPRLAGLLGLEATPTGTREELFAAWSTFFRRIAERGPSILVFEDLQWADTGLVDFIEHLLVSARGVPLLVVTLARPELLERRPGWGTAARSFAAIGLEPLDEAAMGDLVRGLLPEIEEPALAAIIGRSEGIPLYAVETVRMLLDRGQLTEVDAGRYRLTGSFERLDIPETLQALIAARLDALEPELRSLLQVGGVLGQSFTVAALRELSGASDDILAPRLTALARHELLSVDADPRSPERGQYQFVQSVVREVAYQSLARAQRRALHVAAARYFEAQGEDELAPVLASHYLEAQKASPRGPEADALAAQARVALRGAAERAAALHNHGQALGYLEQALSVIVEPAEQAALHERAAQAANWANRYEAGLEHARSAAAGYRTLGDRLGTLRAITSEATLELSQHQDAHAIPLLERALAEAADLPPSRETAEAQAELARALMISGHGGAIEWCDRVLAAPDVAGPELLVSVMITKGTVLAHTSSVVEAEMLLRGAVAVAERIGNTASVLRASNNLLAILAVTSLPESAEMIRQAYEVAQRVGLRTWVHQFLGENLTIAFDMGDWEAWTDRIGVDEADASGWYRGWYQSEQAIRHAFRGSQGEAEAIYNKAMSVSGTGSGQREAFAALWRGCLLLAAGRWEEAHAAADVALRTHGEAASSGGMLAVVAVVALRDGVRAAALRSAMREAMRPGLLSDALQRIADAADAMLREAWDESRQAFVEGRRRAEQVGHRMLLHLSGLALGTLAAGRFPEADAAVREAEQFFTERGAEAFLRTYREHVTGPPINAIRDRAGEAAEATVGDESPAR